ncbi:unnamed protein product [Echinostoma caproni]|uniref:SUZ domain-containing protein n=1 Tax=Echinostoma caproni TaxID=27848 RepID=A0A183AFP7_9TREM|nr:unnamed protein product [Echinostoma caproni]
MNDIDKSWDIKIENDKKLPVMTVSVCVTKDVAPKGPTEEEIEASLNAAEEKRRERFENMEEERESMRQVIRDKYGIKKKEMLDVNEPETYRRPSTPRHSVLMVNPPKRTTIPEEDQGTTSEDPYEHVGISKT